MRAPLPRMLLNGDDILAETIHDYLRLLVILRRSITKEPRYLGFGLSLTSLCCAAWLQLATSEYIMTNARRGDF